MAYSPHDTSSLVHSQKVWKPLILEFAPAVRQSFGKSALSTAVFGVFGHKIYCRTETGGIHSACLTLPQRRLHYSQQRCSMLNNHVLANVFLVVLCDLCYAPFASAINSTDHWVDIIPTMPEYLSLSSCARPCLVDVAKAIGCWSYGDCHYEYKSNANANFGRSYVVPFLLVRSTPLLTRSS
jgi:hypothetical protein